MGLGTNLVVDINHLAAIRGGILKQTNIRHFATAAIEASSLSAECKTHMARYFFHIYDGVSLKDDRGTELPGLQEAQQEAIRYAGTVISDNAKTAKLGEDWRLEVTDENGMIFFRLDFLISGSAAAMT